MMEPTLPPLAVLIAAVVIGRWLLKRDQEIALAVVSGVGCLAALWLGVEAYWAGLV